MSGYDPAPQFNRQGDYVMPHAGVNGHGDWDYHQTNGYGDIVMPSHGSNGRGDTRLIPTNPRTGDYFASPLPPIIPEDGIPREVQARYARERAALGTPDALSGVRTLRDLTTLEAVRYLQERKIRADAQAATRAGPPQTNPGDTEPPQTREVDATTQAIPVVKTLGELTTAEARRYLRERKARSMAQLATEASVIQTGQADR